jgi:hypothetical protein
MPGDKAIVSPKVDRVLGELWDDAEARSKVELARMGALSPRVPLSRDAVRPGDLPPSTAGRMRAAP